MSDPLAAYNAYKSTTQATNPSSSISPTNPGEYSSSPNAATAYEILQARDQAIQQAQQAQKVQAPQPPAPTRIANAITDTSPPDYSKGTRDFISQQADILSKLQDAKNQGFTSLDILDNNGLKIGSVDPRNITAARFDLLKAASTHGGYAELSGTMQTNSGGSAIDYRKSLANAEGVLSQPQESEVSSFLRFPFSGGKTYNAILGSIGLKPTAGKSQTSLIPSTSLADVLQFVPVGGKLLELGSETLGKGISKAAPVIKSVITPKSVSAGYDVAQPKQILRYRPTNMYRNPLPKDIFSQDTATPQAIKTVDYLSKFSKDNLNLGKGIGRDYLGGNGKVYGPQAPPPPPGSINPKDFSSYFKGREDQFKNIAKSKGYDVTKTDKGYKTTKANPSSSGSASLLQIKEPTQIIKQTTKTLTKRLKPQFELRQAVKQQNYLNRQQTQIKVKVPKIKVTKAQIGTQNYLKQLQKNRRATGIVIDTKTGYGYKVKTRSKFKYGIKQIQINKIGLRYAQTQGQKRKGKQSQFTIQTPRVTTKQKQRFRFIYSPRIITIPKPKIPQPVKFKIPNPVPTTTKLKIPGRTTTRPPPTIAIPGFNLYLSGGRGGGNTGRKKRGKTTYFAYNVNPNVVGQLVTLGSPSKVVSSNAGKIIRYKPAKIKFKIPKIKIKF